MKINLNKKFFSDNWLKNDIFGNKISYKIIIFIKYKLIYNF
jgi:mRNA-degrading endonuclease HigB of HigAB toxin-antitoxin module